MNKLPDSHEFLPDARAIEERPLPVAARGTLYLLLGLLVTGILWASISEMDRIVVARGKLVTTPTTMVLQSLEIAVIRSIDVDVGQIVKKGQKVASLDQTFAGADLAQVKGRHASLKAHLTRLEAELAERKPWPSPPATREEQLQAQLWHERQQHYAARLREFQENAGRLSATIATTRRDQSMLRQRLDGVKQMEQMDSRLAGQHFVSQRRALESREQRLAIEQDSQRAEHREVELERELAGIEASQGSFVKEWRQKALEEAVTVRRDLDALSEQLEKAARRSELVSLVAPADAVVQDIAKRSPGSVVKEAEPIVVLVPLDAPLEAEVQVDASDIGFVRTRDPARVKIDAFPFQKHGTLDATTRTLSEDAFVRERMLPGQENGKEAYYQARLELGPMNLRDVPRQVRLLPGMTITAEIVVGRRKVISYFLYPLIRALDEGMREP